MPANPVPKADDERSGASGDPSLAPPQRSMQESSSSDGGAKATTKTTPVYFWYLGDGKTENDKPAYAESLGRVGRGGVPAMESVVNTVDGRTAVDLDDYQKADGKYRAIVKLFLLFEGQTSGNVEASQATWAMATGWLVAKDIVVTAGHCAYSHSGGFGRLVQVKAYMGYTGQGSIGTEEVEFRYGTVVATTDGWINTEGGKEGSDVAVIKLNSPFNAVSNCFSFHQTPISQQAADLGVVGYAGDIRYGEERGARMYQMFKKTDYNLVESDLHMLQYKIDTYGGNSGSPVFNDRKSLTAIGIHVLGGHSVNSASVIAGPYGNRLLALQTVAGGLAADSKQSDGVDQPDKDKRPWLLRKHETTTESAEHDLMRDRLLRCRAQAERVVEQIPGKILLPGEFVSYGSEVGPQISALAAAAIAAAGRLAADGVSATHAEALAETRSYDGILQRAVLAEAAVQSYLQAKVSDGEKKQMEEFLGPLVAGLTPFVRGLAPKVIKSVLVPSLRLLLASKLSSKPELVQQREAARGDRNEAEKGTGFGRDLTPDESTFVKGLMDQVADADVEAFTYTECSIGIAIGSAFKKAGPVIESVSHVGLPLLLPAASGVASSPASRASRDDLDPLAQRAILAEACLQAYVKMPQIAKKHGLFRKMVKVLADIGPKLLTAAPHVVKLVGPIVADMLREKEEKKREFLDFTWGNRREFLDFTWGNRREFLDFTWGNKREFLDFTWGNK